MHLSELIVHLYTADFRWGVRRRHSKPPNSGPHFWSIFYQFEEGYSVADYASIWTPFSPDVTRLGVLYNALNVS